MDDLILWLLPAEIQKMLLAYMRNRQIFIGKRKAMSCDWPFVYFPGGFISLLFGDYTNIHMKISVYTPLTVENISS